MYASKHSIVHKNIHKVIIGLSLPGMVSSVMQTLYQLVDAYWVGKLGPAALAAIGGSSFILWAVYSLTALSSNGISALVAQHIGAGDESSARSAAAQGMFVSTISAVVLGFTVYFGQGLLYRIMGFDSQVTQMSYQYMSIILVGIVFSFWFTGLEAVFRGIGDTHTPMIIIALALTINAILDPVFIFGWMGFPAMGIAGAAWASVLAQLLAMVLASYFLYRKKFLPLFEKQGKSPLRIQIITRILNIGAPVGFGGFFFSLIYVGLTAIISRFGTEAIAAIGVCHRIEGIAWFACVGFAAAASTLVGQFVGAGNLKKAEHAAWWVNGYGGLTLLLVSIIFYFFPAELMSIFTNVTAVQSIGVEYFKIIALFEIFLAFEVIMEGAFSGAGYTLPVMLVTVPITAARIPLAWYLAIYLEMGSNGIWWAIATTTFLKGILTILLFKRGVWLKKLQAVV